MDIASKLGEFDGRDVGPLRELAEHVAQADDPWRELIACARRRATELQVGATWVIKALLESGTPPPPRLAGRLVVLLGRVDAPDAMLHLLQCLPFVEIPASREDELYRLLDTCTSHEHKFVRAWAYNGLGLLAEQNPKLRAAVEKRLARALPSEAASVKARIRHAQKALARAGDG